MTHTLTARLQHALHRLLGRFSYGVTNYRHPIRAAGWSAASRIPRRIPTVTTPLECAEIYNVAKACAHLNGDIAEAGVYRGGTAAILLTASPKHLHLFDTFSGLPSGDGQFGAGEYAGSPAQVTKNLSPWAGRFSLHPGIFPESAVGLDHLRFSFVHLDLDLYDGTRDALRWFWPRLNRGGILLSHDYPYSDGVVQAFSEFVPGCGGTFLPLSGSQCIVVKLA